MADHDCSPVGMTRYAKFSSITESLLEMKKAHPARYPANRDSIGIELVGEVSTKTGIFVTTTEARNAALKWLVGELAQTFRVQMTDVFRHPQLSRKTPSEASTARW
ncbi:N-acetylmuramoyl-L-alanine amidase [Sphingomonadaceae bacterium OTU29LAMAA1]|nr:N-acetylmuramoyl-L-alanine amidase [Sphingomonadaceae bacterium OTU29LAMAA1]